MPSIIIEVSSSMSVDEVLFILFIKNIQKPVHAFALIVSALLWSQDGYYLLASQKYASFYNAGEIS